MGDGERGLEAWVAQLRVAATTARVVVVPSAPFPRTRVLGLLGEGPMGDLHVLEQPPTSWDTLVRESRAVFVPNAGLNAVAGIATLLAMEPAVGAALRGLIEGRPVLVGSDEIDFLTLHAAHLARPFVQGVRGHASAARSMGARLLEAAALGQELVRMARNEADFAPAQQPSRGRTVLTKEDVEMLIRAGQQVIEVPAGSIVTSLAREVASHAGVEIMVR